MGLAEVIVNPTVIFQTHSDLNGDILVTSNKSTLRLVVGGTTQSVNAASPLAQRLYWGHLVELLKQEVPMLKTILILGLGGGTMAYLISKAFPGVKITSVEIDSVIVETAKKYFELDAIPNHKVIVDDACRVIVEPEKYGLSTDAFDCVVVDIFVGSQYPELGKSGNFMARIADMIKPGGLAVFSRYYLEEHQADVQSFIEQIRNFYVDVNSVVVPGRTNSDNILIYARA